MANWRNFRINISWVTMANLPLKQRIKKCLTALGLLFVIFWFWGNAALYLEIDDFFQSHYLIGDLNEALENLVLPEANIDGEYLHFFNFKIKMPFLKNKRLDYLHSLPIEGQLWTINLSYREKRKPLIDVSLSETLYWIYEEEDPIDSFIQKFVFGITSGREFYKASMNAKKSDLSWWNPIKNLRLYAYLSVQFLTMDSRYRMHYVKFAAIEGLLKEGLNEKRGDNSFHFFTEPGEFYLSLNDYGNNIFDINKIVRTIKPIEDAGKSFSEMETLYKDNPGYPEELLILGMISLQNQLKDKQKRSLLKVLREHLALEESRPDADDYIYKQYRSDLKGYIIHLQNHIANSPHHHPL